MEFDKTFIRLEKIKTVLLELRKTNQNLRERLRRRDEPLVTKVRKLERALAAAESRERARENILRSLSPDKSFEEFEKEINDKYQHFNT